MAAAGYAFPAGLGIFTAFIAATLGTAFPFLFPFPRSPVFLFPFLFLYSFFYNHFSQCSLSLSYPLQGLPREPRRVRAAHDPKTLLLPQHDPSEAYSEVPTALFYHFQKEESCHITLPPNCHSHLRFRKMLLMLTEHKF